MDILEAKLPPKDTFMSASDGYVKLSIKGPAGDIQAGQTKVIWDTARPVFNHTFKIERISISSTVFFEIFDKDMMGGDDYIATIYIPIKKILSDHENGKPITLKFPDGWIKTSVTWLGNET